MKSMFERFFRRMGNEPNFFSNSRETTPSVSNERSPRDTFDSSGTDPDLDLVAIDLQRGKVREILERIGTPPLEKTQSSRELEQLGRRNIFDKDRKVAVAIAGASVGFTTGATAAVLMGFGQPLAVGSLAVAGGYAAWKLKWQSLSGVDWVARKLDKWADGLIDKKLPVLKYIVNPTAKLLDGMAKFFGLDKSLAEHLKKKNDAREKLAEKVFKDYRDSQKKYEVKLDAAAEKARRRKTIEDKLGKDVAEAIMDDVDAIAAAAEAKDTPQPAPVEPKELVKET